MGDFVGTLGVYLITFCVHFTHIRRAQQYGCVRFCSLLILNGTVSHLRGPARCKAEITRKSATLFTGDNTYATKHPLIAKKY